ncbi:MAG: EAL domain-containing protein [Candidatus Devosia symbiotica]|nr:EAL domain-containing protein [Candidatus Devosia symbiotica]
MILNRLKKIRVSIALDDFGAGYSSLGYLNHLPFDPLKIDRSFVRNVHASESKRQLLAGMISIGKGLGLFVLAEGAETAEEMASVATLDCDNIQGFFYARPMPAAIAPQADGLLTRGRQKPAPQASLAFACGC